VTALQAIEVPIRRSAEPRTKVVNMNDLLTKVSAKKF
jgi:hypothetical protein